MELLSLPDALLGEILTHLPGARELAAASAVGRPLRDAAHAVCQARLRALGFGALLLPGDESWAALVDYAERVHRAQRPCPAAAGASHTLWLVDGALMASGDDAEGRGDKAALGIDCDDGEQEPVYTPVPVPALQGVRVLEVAAGITHSLALASSGDVWSFGRNHRGQLGRGSLTVGDDPGSGPARVDGLEGVARGRGAAIRRRLKCVRRESRLTVAAPRPREEKLRQSALHRSEEQKQLKVADPRRGGRARYRGGRGGRRRVRGGSWPPTGRRRPTL